MGEKESLIREIGLFKNKTSKKFPLEKVILFGSRAGNRYSKYSDVDLIIVSPKFEGMNFFERAARMYDFWTLDMPVDFLCYSTAEFNKKAGQVSIVSEAMKKGVAI